MKTAIWRLEEARKEYGHYIVLKAQRDTMKSVNTPDEVEARSKINAALKESIAYIKTKLKESADNLGYELPPVKNEDAMVYAYNTLAYLVGQMLLTMTSAPLPGGVLGPTTEWFRDTDWPRQIPQPKA